MLQVEYLPLESAAEYVKRAGPGLLGVLGFPAVPDDFATDVPTACVAAANLRAGPAGALCEIWSSRAPAGAGAEGDIRLATAGDFLFGVLCVPEGEGGLRKAAEEAYRGIFALLDRRGFPHAVRFWNYLARINEEEDGLERYRHFNLGRGAAFEATGRFNATIPAACALGAEAGQRLTVYFVAARHPAQPVENPRQVSAYRYPSEHGPHSPTFSRAVVYPAGGAEMLFVSGTASIVGHRTLHAGDVAAQTRETLANLEAVFAEANRVSRPGAFAIREASFKVYVRRADDAERVRREVFAALGDGADAHFLRADICRRDLLVEIEAIAWADPAGERLGR